jgi:preprotein translocase subunit SecG
VIHKRIADHRRRVARLNRYVAVVALLWLVTSVALLFFARPRRANIAGSDPASHSVHAADLPFRVL